MSILQSLPESATAGIVRGKAENTKYQLFAVRNAVGVKIAADAGDSDEKRQWKTYTTMLIKMPPTTESA
jgi:hypothetical protein